jgi:type I restriction enzyme R subunit
VVSLLREGSSIRSRIERITGVRASVNQAIAEWATASGPADYVLFLGLTPLGIAEAKRHIVDVPGRRIPQLP